MLWILIVIILNIMININHDRKYKIILVVIDLKYRFNIFRIYRWVIFWIWNKTYFLFLFFIILLSILHKNIVLLMIMTVVVWKQKKKNRWILMSHVFSLYSNSCNIYNTFDVFSSLLLFYDIFFQNTVFFNIYYEIFKEIYYNIIDTWKICRRRRIWYLYFIIILYKFWYIINKIKSVYYFEMILILKASTNIRDMANIMWQKEFNKIF